MTKEWSEYVHTIEEGPMSSNERERRKCIKCTRTIRPIYKKDGFITNPVPRDFWMKYWDYCFLCIQTEAILPSE